MVGPAQLPKGNGVGAESPGADPEAPPPTPQDAPYRLLGQERAFKPHPHFLRGVSHTQKLQSPNRGQVALYSGLVLIKKNFLT